MGSHMHPCTRHLFIIRRWKGFVFERSYGINEGDVLLEGSEIETQKQSMNGQNLSYLNLVNAINSDQCSYFHQRCRPQSFFPIAFLCPSPFPFLHFLHILIQFHKNIFNIINKRISRKCFVKGFKNYPHEGERAQIARSWGRKMQKRNVSISM